MDHNRESRRAIQSIIVLAFVGLLAVGGVGLIYFTGALSSHRAQMVHVEMKSVSQGCTVNGVCGTALSYSPGNITVVIGVNNTVEWTNADPVDSPHTVTEGKFFLSSSYLSRCYQCPTATPLFDSGDVQNRGNFTYTFTSPGIYEYFCIYHRGMFGFVIVKG